MLGLEDFKRYTLTYHVNDGYTTDDRGNRVPNRVPRTLLVNLKAKSAARMSYRTGADEGVLPVEGACFKPRIMPREIPNGREFAFDFDGRPAKLTLHLLPRRALAELDREFGQKFEGEVRF